MWITDTYLLQNQLPRDTPGQGLPIYKKTAAYGHFGREDEDFTWEKTDKAEILKKLNRVKN